MKYRRMPIEEESPEQFGYERIRCNLTESSVRDRSLSDLGVALGDALLFYGDHAGNERLPDLIAAQSAEAGGVTRDDVLVTAGAAQALFIIATSLLDKGDHLVGDVHGAYVGPGHWFEQDRRHMRIGYAWPLPEELESGLAAVSGSIRAALRT